MAIIIRVVTICCFEYNIKDTFMVDDGLGTLERKETLYRHTQKVGRSYDQ
jgi:hypothetical protein